MEAGIRPPGIVADLVQGPRDVERLVADPRGTVLEDPRDRRIGLGPMDRDQDGPGLRDAERTRSKIRAR